MISSKDFFLALDDLEREKKIDKEYFLTSLESALTSAYKKDFGEAQSVSVKLNPDKHTIKVVAYKTIVEEVLDPDKEISLADAKLQKSTYKIGDTITQEVTPKNFGRIAAQTARQVVMQKLREAERGVKTQDINEKSDQLTTGIVTRLDGQDVYLEIGGFDLPGLLAHNDQIPGEKFVIGQRVKVCIKRIRGEIFGNVPVTRVTTGFVRKLLELEVPEFESGDIELKGISREAGNRTKIALYSKNPNIDCVGTCVGVGGARINAVINELNGEKIDIIRWSEDIFEFIAASLNPAEVNSVEINELTKSSKVIVPDNKLSLAIGKGGLNVRLAAKLTGWSIDVKSESQSKLDEQKASEMNDLSLDKVDAMDIFEDLETLD